MSIETAHGGGAEVRVSLSPEAVERVRALIGLGLAASIEDYVADSVRNRLAGFQDLAPGASRRPDGDPREWVVPGRRT
ncbi:hypothetical protein [Streptomyces sp. SID3343]|uniref:hypothetical protein n=1 Tax=Streptomyces sp. SID3343 TaxID=2690260 RepID=UPI00136CF180|nr:hypothetical protein [Streptomyces sp. SID3343]MYW00527.1 hypothetical protein [Streptomyces sp. SID3343]